MLNPFTWLMPQSGRLLIPKQLGVGKRLNAELWSIFLQNQVKPRFIQIEKGAYSVRKVYHPLGSRNDQSDSNRIDGRRQEVRCNNHAEYSSQWRASSFVSAIHQHLLRITFMYVYGLYQVYWTSKMKCNIRQSVGRFLEAGVKVELPVPYCEKYEFQRLRYTSLFAKENVR